MKSHKRARKRFVRLESSTLATVWTVPIEGGTPVRAMEGFALRPVISPDGKGLVTGKTTDRKLSLAASGDLTGEWETTKDIRRGFQYSDYLEYPSALECG